MCEERLSRSGEIRAARNVNHDTSIIGQAGRAVKLSLCDLAACILDETLGRLARALPHCAGCERVIWPWQSIARSDHGLAVHLDAECLAGLAPSDALARSARPRPMFEPPLPRMSDSWAKSVRRPSVARDERE